MKFYPATKKVYLHLAAGLMWAGVGIMLISLAAKWLQIPDLVKAVLLTLAGLTLATAIYYFGFSVVAKKNIRRIEAYPQEKVCVFAFQKWTSYPLIMFMVALGLYLRIYSPIPKPILAILYIGLGVSLFLSSLLYYAKVLRISANVR